MSVINESGVRDVLQYLIAEQGTKKRRKAMTDPLAAWVEALGTTRLGLRPPAEVEADYAPDVTGFADIAPQYAQVLHERGVVDFDHQIIRAIEVLLTDTRARFAARRACGRFWWTSSRTSHRLICCCCGSWPGRPPTCSGSATTTRRSTDTPERRRDG